MRKILLLVLCLGLLGFMANAQDYDDNNDYGDSYNTDYDDDYLSYENGYENAMPYLNNYNGVLYYWVHPYENLYFVLIGRRVFVIPSYQIRRIWHNFRWVLLSMNNFVSYSSFGLPYYDNWVRFHYYYDYFYRNRYNRYNCRWIRGRYRSYYRNRRSNRNYYGRYRTVMKNRRTGRTRINSRRSFNKNRVNTRYNNRRSNNSRLNTRRTTNRNNNSYHYNSRQNNGNRRINRKHYKKENYHD